MTIQQSVSVIGEPSYLASCEIPEGMLVRVCVAIRWGKVLGATVETDPPSRGKGDCVANAVRSAPLALPASPTLDLTRTQFIQ